MKTDTMEAKAQDRLATYEEVRCANASTEERVLGSWHTQGNYCEMDSDFGGVIRYPAEEFEFLAYLSDMDETATN